MADPGIIDPSNIKSKGQIDTRVPTTTFETFDKVTSGVISGSNGTDKETRKNIIPRAKSALITTTQKSIIDQNNNSTNSLNTPTSRTRSKSQLSVPNMDTGNKPNRRAKSAKTPRSSAKTTRSSTATPGSTRKKLKITKEDKERQKQRKTDLKKLK